jgi:NTP pyrophosphatase (non-canonical NTP hydrolase)
VAEFQALIRDLYLAKDRARGTERTFLWLVEEVGELSVALRDKDPAAIREELADVVAWTVSVANLAGVDLAEALAAKYPAKCARCGARPCGCAEPAGGA